MGNRRLLVAVPVLALIAGAALGQAVTDAPHDATHLRPNMQSEMPIQPGQAAFAAIREIVGILEADPHTDWSRVNIPALREHLIDMNEVTLNAEAKSKRIPGGVRIVVTGKGRTLAAIRRMVPMHARVMNGRDGWSWSTEPVSDGVVMTVTAHNPTQVVMIRGLGFMGLMVQGTHHGMHHLAIARGEMKY